MTFKSLGIVCACATLLPCAAYAQRSRSSQGNRSAAGVTYDACRLLSIADVTPILGNGATQQMTMHGQNCEFLSADKKHKLFVRTPETMRTSPELTLKHFRDGPHHNYTMADEKELGDDAASAITPSGVEIMAIKQHRVLYIQDYGAYGSTGSSEQLNKLRPLARKAAAAF